MPELKLNGKTYSGSTSYASAINYTEADGSKTTVQDKISELAYRPVNNNLLINSNFANPVNQRGITAGNWTVNSYGLDRWCIGNGNGIKLDSMNSNGITISHGTEAGSILTQKVELSEFDMSKTYTFSFYLNGKVRVFTKDFSDFTVGTDEWYQSQSDEDGIFLAISYKPTKSFIDFFIASDNVSTYTIKWAKLELGEVATPYVPRLYAEEWLLCQRFYKVFAPMRIATYAAGNTELIDTIPIDMRVNPTVTLGINRVSNITNADISSWANKKVVQIFVKKASNGHFDLNMDVTLDAEL